jgi:hypothetical protein
MRAWSAAFTTPLRLGTDVLFFWRIEPQISDRTGGDMPETAA